MTVAVAGSGGRKGVTLAEVNLKLVWDVISQIRIGASGHAFAVDRAGRLIADPDISRVLRATDLSQLGQVRSGLAAAADPQGQSGPAEATINDAGVRVLSAWAPIAELGWIVFAELPIEEANAPLYASLRRTGLLIFLGLAVSGVASLLLARRMVGPIQALGLGAARIGGGELGYRIELRTGDELEGLADRFNRMSESLLESRDRAERLGRLKRFLSPQLAELVETSGSHELLESHRREITVVFCDLRGFTSFSAKAAARGGDPHPERISRRPRRLDLRARRYAGALHGRRADGFLQRPLRALTRPSGQSGWRWRCATAWPAWPGSGREGAIGSASASGSRRARPRSAGSASRAASTTLR